jgi:hypothetical protein
MRHYGAKRVPKGSSSLAFELLNPAEQLERIQKLKDSRLSFDAIADLTGLTKVEIFAMLEKKP